jgi:defect-in-organelle-trafficking protein DotB
MLVDIPARVNGVEHLQLFLAKMEELGGSDLFIMGNSPVWLSLHGKKVKLSSRSLSDQEVIGFATELYDVSAQSSLFSGQRIDIPYEFKRKYTDIDGTDRRERLRYRVNMISCLRSSRNSLTITIRGIPTTPPRARDMGVEADILEVADKTDQGLILVVGATGSGKSTLMASMLREQLEAGDAHRNLVTVEHPIEFVYDEVEMPSSFVTQMQVGKNIASFHEGVVNCMRMAPTTILVGELRDYETVSAALEASVTGHTVLGTAHANSVSEVFQRLVAVYPEDLQSQAKYDIVQASKMVIAQRLLPTVDGKRVAVREYLILDQTIKDRLINSKNIGTEAFLMVKEFGRPMMADIEAKYKAGIIDEKIYERQRINYDLIENKII